MSTNPFDDLASQLATLTAKVEEIRSLVSVPKAEWEPIAVAIETRRKARKTLMWAVRTGQVKSQTVPSPRGRDSLVLLVSDLDQHYPVRK